MRLVLGTAQFGADYGVSNTEGKVKKEEVSSILNFARVIGVEEIDTAYSYGDVLDVLGDVGVEDFKITSKIPKIGLNDFKGRIRFYIEDTYRRLGVDSINNMLLHDENDMYEGVEKLEYLQSIKDEYCIRHVGASLYRLNGSFAELSALLEVIQISGNIFDRRFRSLSVPNIYLRSVFLQGLLLMGSRPSYFDKWEHLFSRYDAYAREIGGGVKACINFINSASDNKVIVGVQSTKQLEEINELRNFTAKIAIPAIESFDEDLIFPSRWCL